MKKAIVLPLSIFILGNILNANAQSIGATYLIECPAPQDVTKYDCLKGELCHISAMLMAKKYAGEGPDMLKVVADGMQLEKIEPTAARSAALTLGCTYANSKGDYIANLWDFNAELKFQVCKPMDNNSPVPRLICKT